ncbi:MULTISPECIES: ImmA/IrrE family metallo-endopeptidase [unclassified Luteococcus]|uniref:ImmA/IrrE family metallo-endopeptidase n=1 Tax=unclassified Luteococcus TaxID=2639923 RepID=UPI00313EEFF4
MTEVAVSAPVLTWAQRRSGRDDEEIRHKFAEWDEWLAEESSPSFAEVEKIAEFTRVPLGYFFLPEPPIEELPIPDLRVGRGQRVAASADLLDTIYLNQRRQAWYEDYLADQREPEPLEFVGSAAHWTVSRAAREISAALDYSVAARQRFRTMDEARAHLVASFEGLGGLVVLNSMVANNTQRMLDLEEFRGFTLHSLYAPLVFVNSHDTKNGQVFSLLHEFAHVWRGESGVSQGGDPLHNRSTDTERWCDAVAAEVAVPTKDLERSFSGSADLTAELDRLAGRYRCSTLVILLKLKEAELIPTGGFAQVYAEELDRLIHLAGQAPPGGGGDFYNNQPYRIGRTLSRAIVRDARRGGTSMTEALRLLAFGRIGMFDSYARRLEEG